MPDKLTTRRYALYSVAVVCLAYTRTRLQYGHAWQDWAAVGSSLLIHGIALFLFVAFTYVAIGVWRERLLPKDEPEPSIDAVSVYVALAVIVASVWVLILSVGVPTDDPY